MSVIIGSQPSSHTLCFSEEGHDTQIGLLKLEEAGASLVGTGSGKLIYPWDLQFTYATEIGATVVIGKKEDGSYVATYQVVVSNLPPATPEKIGFRKEIKYNIAGLIDVSTFSHYAANAWRFLQMAHPAVDTFPSLSPGSNHIRALKSQPSSSAYIYQANFFRFFTGYRLPGDQLVGNRCSFKHSRICRWHLLRPCKQQRSRHRAYSTAGRRQCEVLRSTGKGDRSSCPLQSHQLSA